MGSALLRSERTGLDWLLTLRWAAVAGQTATILVVHVGFHVVLPLPWLFGIVGLEALSNLLAQRKEWPDPQGLVVILMVIDLLALTGLLYFSGGPHNPFNFLYLVNIALASVVLEARATWILAAVSAGLFALLFVDHVPLPDPSNTNPGGGGPMVMDHGDHAGHGGGMDAMTMHVRGMWVGFAVASVFIAYFVTRVRRELDDARRQNQTNARLAGLATLAAGAAHELGTPLGTIAIVSRELERHLETLDGEEEATEDARLIRQEVNRCRTVLDQMSVEAGESVGEALQKQTVADWIGRALDGFDYASKVTVPEGADAVTIFGPQTGLARSLRSVVKNAFEANAATVMLRLASEGDLVRLDVVDDGTGMPPLTASRAGEPFYTTKPTGEGMGLGLFLARTLAERLGGGLRVQSTAGVGTTVSFLLPHRAR